MDEPLSNLDAKLRVEMARGDPPIQRASRVTTVFVTHGPGEALSISDSVIVLKNGVSSSRVGPYAL
jgi:ABC-type sugar transport system ATPase subunit